MDAKQSLREARWAWWLPAAFLAGICLLPSGHIEASPGEFLRPPVWMAPMAWPLLAMAVLFAGAAFSERLRMRAWQIVFLGAGASLLFELVLVVSSGSAALYSWELKTNLQNRIFTDFELDVLAFLVLPMDLLLVATSFLVLWVRFGKLIPAFLPARGPSGAPAIPAPSGGVALAAESAPAQEPAAPPTAPPAPPDAIAPEPPAPAPQNESPSAGPAAAAIQNEPVAPGPATPVPVAQPPATGATIGAPGPDAPAPRPGPAPEAIPPPIPQAAPTFPPAGAP